MVCNRTVLTTYMYIVQCPHNWCRTQFEKAVNLSAINPSGLQQLSLKLYGIILQHTFEKKEFLVNPKIFLVF